MRDAGGPAGGIVGRGGDDAVGAGDRGAVAVHVVGKGRRLVLRVRERRQPPGAVVAVARRAAGQGVAGAATVGVVGVAHRALRRRHARDAAGGVVAPARRAAAVNHAGAAVRVVVGLGDGATGRGRRGGVVAHVVAEGHGDAAGIGGAGQAPGQVVRVA